MSDVPPVTVGTMLVLRDRFERKANDENAMGMTRAQARILIQILDELIGHREKEAQTS